jgi:glycine betaine/proline transport system substrate-binding protein
VIFSFFLRIKKFYLNAVEKRCKFITVIISISMLWALSMEAFARPPESKEPIRIITNNWSSQIVLASILGEIYSRRGYAIKYVELTSLEQWGRLHRGHEHIQVEVWEGTMKEDFERVSKFGNIIDAGNHDAKTREEWWYPSYVEKTCPGLPDWEALKNCAEQFSGPSLNGKGQYVAGPWEKPDAARIRALGMNFIPVRVKHADDLWVKLDKAYKEKKPIVLFNWSPNWVESRYSGKFIEFPKHEKLCETDPGWGINKTKTYDCGNPKNGWLKKVAWKGVKDRWPCAMGILRDMNFSNMMISEVAALVDADGKSHQEAATIWLNSNKEIWQDWGSEICN